MKKCGREKSISLVSFYDCTNPENGVNVATMAKLCYMYVISYRCSNLRQTEVVHC